MRGKLTFVAIVFIPLFLGCSKRDELKPADPPQAQCMEQKYLQQEVSNKSIEQINAKFC